MADHALSVAEETVMKDTFKASMLRAADIIDRITEKDVMDAQVALYREGVAIVNLGKIDRALLASCHLRACAARGSAARVTTDELKGRLKV